MRAVLLSCVLALALASPCFADVPAVSYYVVKKADLRKLLPADKDLSSIPLDQIEKISLLQGTFQVPCKLNFKNTNYQFRIEVKRIKESDRLSFSLGGHSEKEKTSFHCCGAVNVGKTLTAKKDWDSPLSENQYVVLFRQVNLKS